MGCEGTLHVRPPAGSMRPQQPPSVPVPAAPPHLDPLVLAVCHKHGARSIHGQADWEVDRAVGCALQGVWTCQLAKPFSSGRVVPGWGRGASQNAVSASLKYPLTWVSKRATHLRLLAQLRSVASVRRGRAGARSAPRRQNAPHSSTARRM